MDDREREGSPDQADREDAVMEPENGDRGMDPEVPGEAAGAAGDEGAPEGEDRDGLQRMLAAEKERAEDYFNRLARLQADFDNYRRRVTREREELLKYANEQLILSLLPVVDNFERALESKNGDNEKLVAGVEMISRQFGDILAREGLEPIPAVGEQFNPEIHEAVMKEESGEHPENTVTQELRRGFTYKGKVIRAAMVKVAG